MNRPYHHVDGWLGMAGILALLASPSTARSVGFSMAAFQQWNTPTHTLHSQRQIPLFMTSTLGNRAEPENSQFGRQDYWNQFYQETSQFSWYAGWNDLEPFVQEFITVDDTILIPGVGNDAMLVDMYQAGYTQLTAMDYAAEAIARCRDMLHESKKQQSHSQSSQSQSSINANTNVNDEGVTLVVADARDLGHVFEDHSFQAIIEKGTLDAIFLSGGQNKTLAQENMNLAISELGRCLKPGGIWISIAAVVDTQIQNTFDALGPEWECLVRREELFVTEDGYTSNNIDGSLLVWRKR